MIEERVVDNRGIEIWGGRGCQGRRVFGTSRRSKRTLETKSVAVSVVSSLGHRPPIFVMVL